MLFEAKPESVELTHSSRSMKVSENPAGDLYQPAFERTAGVVVEASSATRNRNIAFGGARRS